MRHEEIVSNHSGAGHGHRAVQRQLGGGEQTGISRECDDREFWRE